MRVKTTWCVGFHAYSLNVSLFAIRDDLRVSWYVCAGSVLPDSHVRCTIPPCLLSEIVWSCSNTSIQSLWCIASHGCCWGFLCSLSQMIWSFLDIFAQALWCLFLMHIGKFLYVCWQRRCTAALLRLSRLMVHAFTCILLEFFACYQRWLRLPCHVSSSHRRRLLAQPNEIFSWAKTSIRRWSHRRHVCHACRSFFALSAVSQGCREAVFARLYTWHRRSLARKWHASLWK